MYRNLGYPSFERLWHIAVAFLIFCALFALGYSSVFVPFAAVESLQFCFCTYETAFHVELQSSFFADASSSQWLIDSGASKHMCFDQDSFDQNTFVSGTPLGVSGVVMGKLLSPLALVRRYKALSCVTYSVTLCACSPSQLVVCLDLIAS